jgi:DNA-binding transcriptional LysR family regulator
MELRHLRYVVAVAEELHFGRAALRLNISQPPLSQQIQQIENELGVRIFQRTKREVQLTDAGKRIVAEAYQVLGQVDHLSKVAARASNGEIGQISVGAVGGVNEILVDTLKIFGKQYPGVHVDLQFMCTGEQLERFHEERIQVGFLGLPVKQDKLVTEVVKEQPLLVAMPKSHPLARCQRMTVNELADQPFIFFPRRRSPGLHDFITRMCRNAGFTLNVVHEVDSIDASLIFVRAHLGLAFCVADIEEKPNGIVYRPLKAPEARMQYGMVYKRETLSPVVQSFVSAVRQVVRAR